MDLTKADEGPDKQRKGIEKNNGGKREESVAALEGKGRAGKKKGSDS